ncbi:hypothetical protein CC2G_013225 [Coprinopsis cinerea AmutBmut pab1-1]|nr:hypothetical protein CC2G_013225 [Coprinopsis cinerea AmutBmut pab1-1]
MVIANTLEIGTSSIKTYALQVYIPTSYTGPADQTELGTMYLAYIPTELVDTLAAAIKTRNSKFYTATPGIAGDLAKYVNSGFALRSVQDPGVGNNSGTNGNGAPGNTGATSSDGKSRQDAIIGVVSALGAIALFVLIFLVYRSLKRRRELAHRRLSDPPNADAHGYRPEGREFDQDSIGGQRRRSFYFAEDSLRGYAGAAAQQEYTYNHHQQSQQQMSQRRNINVNPNAISAPILRDNTMNW